jgi:uncharacterized protein (TIGR03435 family)
MPGTRCGVLQMLRIVPLLLWMMLAGTAGAQVGLIVARPGETAPSFEVAAIRPSHSERGFMSINNSRDLLRVENATLRDLIMDAWEIHSKAQIGSESNQILDEHFNIEARVSSEDVARLTKMPAQERSRQQALMLQSLLADRFALKVHIETKTQPVLVLMVGKGGAKLHAAAPDPPDDAASQEQSKPAAGQHPSGVWTQMSQTGAELNAYDSTIEGLVTTIAFQEEAGGRMVIDKTGLTGKYDYSLKWVPEWLSASMPRMDAGSAQTADARPTGPSLFTAVETQLGLKVVREKAPVEVLVIDHVEMPSAN